MAVAIVTNVIALPSAVVVICLIGLMTQWDYFAVIWQIKCFYTINWNVSIPDTATSNINTVISRSLLTSQWRCWRHHDFLKYWLTDYRKHPHFLQKDILHFIVDGFNYLVSRWRSVQSVTWWKSNICIASIKPTGKLLRICLKSWAHMTLATNANISFQNGECDYSPHYPPPRHSFSNDKVVVILRCRRWLLRVTFRVTITF